MVFVPNAAQNTAFLLGQAPAPQLSEAPPTSAPGNSALPSGQTAAPTAGAGGSFSTSAGIAAPDSSGGSLGFGSSGTLQDRLLSPVGQGIDQGRQELQDASQGFFDAAGNSRSFEGIGGQSILDSALQTGNLDPARDLVNASYGGPSQLDYSGPFEGDLQNRTNALGSAGGLQSLARQAMPTLTPGQARFESRRMLGDQAYRDQIGDLQRSSDELFNDIAKEQARASDFAGQRQSEEQSIRDQSRGYLSDVKEGTLSDLATRAEQANQQRDATVETFDQFQQNPAQFLADFVTPKNERNSRFSFDLGGLLNFARGAGGRQAAASQLGASQNELFGVAQQVAPQLEAQRVLSELNQRFEGVPEAQLGITGRGTERLTFDPGNGQQYGLPQALDGHARNVANRGLDLPAGMTREEFQALARRVQDRHDAFSDRFGVNTQTGDRGDLALFDPQFLGGNLDELPSLREFGALDEGSVANVSNVSNQGERDRFNRASEILDSADRLEAVDPARAAGIDLGLEDFLAARAEGLANRESQIAQGEEDWARELRRARARYKDSKDDFFGTIGLPLITLGLAAPPVIAANLAK